MYSDTGLYSCVGVEIGGQPIGTTIANMEARGRTFGLVRQEPVAVVNFM
jgi:hypothetical protein